MGLVWNRRGVVQITECEMALVDLMLRRQMPVYVEGLIQRLYGAEIDGPKWPIQTIRVYISHIRDKLKPIGLTVLSMGYSRGYMIKHA